MTLPRFPFAMLRVLAHRNDVPFLSWPGTVSSCHCEERDSSLTLGTGSAISAGQCDCHSSLAMTLPPVVARHGSAEAISGILRLARNHKKRKVHRSSTFLSLTSAIVPTILFLTI